MGIIFLERLDISDHGKYECTHEPKQAFRKSGFRKVAAAENRSEDILMGF